MLKATETSGHGKGVKFDLESVARRIMFRRLLSLRSPKTDKNEEPKPATIDDKSSINSNNNEEEQEIPEKSEIICSDNFDNKLVTEDAGKKVTEKSEIDQDDALSTENDDKNILVQDEKNENHFNEDSEEENETKDDEKESADEADSSTESIDEDSNSDICKSESYSDTEGKDSGIEKGDSPTLENKDSTDDEENSNEPENISEKLVTGLSANIPDLTTSSFVGTATLNVLSPATTKTKRLVKRSKQRSRKEFDLDSEVSCDCSSPEKPSRRKNMTISYLSYPQRFVRSSLAVEARLSQWRKETSVLENARATCGDTPSRKSITRGDTPTKSGITRGDTPSRNGILKQTQQQRTNKHSALKAQAKDVRFPSSRHYDSDTSSDDETRMSVRKIYSSKSALRKRIENLEGMLLLMATQKCGLEELIVTMETWSLELSHVERTKLGVPYIRSVKDVLKKQRRAITNKTSNFNKLVSRLQDANVPCFKEVHSMIQGLNKEISIIVQDRKRYSSRHIEDIRQTQGNIIGTCSAITAVFYEE